MNVSTTSATGRTIVFVTGAFVSHHCWDDWQTHFAARGYSCHAPPHPYKDGSPAVLRSQHPRSPIARNSLADVLGAYAEFIRGLPEKPFLIGHSYGGLLTQLLLQQNLGSAGVAIDSVPPMGVMSLKWSFIASVTPALGLFSSLDQTYLMSFEHWQYTFTNGMPRSEQLESYERLVVPESKRMSRDALTPAAKIDFSRPHAPLLFIAGSEDHIIPVAQPQQLPAVRAASRLDHRVQGARREEPLPARAVALARDRRQRAGVARGAEHTTSARAGEGIATVAATAARVSRLAVAPCASFAQGVDRPPAALLSHGGAL